MLRKPLFWKNIQHKCCLLSVLKFKILFWNLLLFIEGFAIIEIVYQFKRLLRVPIGQRSLLVRRNVLAVVIAFVLTYQKNRECYWIWKLWLYKPLSCRRYSCLRVFYYRDSLEFWWWSHIVIEPPSLHTFAKQGLWDSWNTVGTISSRREYPLCTITRARLYLFTLLGLGRFIL